MSLTVHKLVEWPYRIGHAEKSSFIFFHKTAFNKEPLMVSDMSVWLGGVAVVGLGSNPGHPIGTSLFRICKYYLDKSCLSHMKSKYYMHNKEI